MSGSSNMGGHPGAQGGIKSGRAGAPGAGSFPTNMQHQHQQFLNNSQRLSAISDPFVKYVLGNYLLEVYAQAFF